MTWKPAKKTVKKERELVGGASAKVSQRVPQKRLPTQSKLGRRDSLPALYRSIALATSRGEEEKITQLERRIINLKKEQKSKKRLQKSNPKSKFVKLQQPMLSEPSKVGRPLSVIGEEPPERRNNTPGPMVDTPDEEAKANGPTPMVDAPDEEAKANGPTPMVDAPDEEPEGNGPTPRVMVDTIPEERNTTSRVISIPEKRSKLISYNESILKELYRKEFLSYLSDPIDVTYVYELFEAIDNHNKMTEQKRFKTTATEPVSVFMAQNNQEMEQQTAALDVAARQAAALEYPVETQTNLKRGRNEISSGRKIKTKRKGKTITLNKKSKKHRKNLMGGSYEIFKSIINKVQTPENIKDLSKEEIYKLFALILIVSDVSHDNPQITIGPDYNNINCTTYNSDNDGCWNFPLNSLITKGAFPGFFRTYNNVIGRPFSKSRSEENLLEYSMENNLFTEVEFKIFPAETDDVLSGISGGISKDNEARLSKSLAIEFNKQGLNDCISYVNNSICSNHILTIDAGGMMSFIRSIVKDTAMQNNVNSESTLLQIFDSASGETINKIKVNEVRNNILFDSARTNFLKYFEGCLDLPEQKISVERAIPILRIINDKTYYTFVDENGNTTYEMPYIKLSLNKLLVAAGFEAERGSATFTTEDKDVIAIKEFLNMSANNAMVATNLSEQYIKKLSKLLKYMGDLFQVLSTNQQTEVDKSLIVYTFDRLCFITGLLLKDPVQYETNNSNFPESVTEYLRTDYYYTDKTDPITNQSVRVMNRYNNYKTLYMAFRVIDKSGKAFVFNSYALLLEYLMDNKTYEDMEDTISVIVRHSKSVNATLSKKKIQEDIVKLRETVVVFYNRIAENLTQGMENIDLIPINYLFVTTETGEIITEILEGTSIPQPVPIDLKEEDVSINMLYQINQVIQQQKELIKQIDAEKLEGQRREHAERNFTTLLKKLNKSKSVSVSKDDINVIIDSKEDITEPYIIQIENPQDPIQIQLFVDKVKKIMNIVYNINPVEFKKIKNKVVATTESFEELFGLDSVRNSFNKDLLKIIINPGRSSSRYYKCDIITLFPLLLILENTENMII